jgi:hypothetical protein
MQVDKKGLMKQSNGKIPRQGYGKKTNGLP